MNVPKKPVFLASGAFMGFFDQAGFKKGLKKLFQLVPDACFGDVRDCLLYTSQWRCCRGTCP